MMMHLFFLFVVLCGIFFLGVLQTLFSDGGEGAYGIIFMAYMGLLYALIGLNRYLLKREEPESDQKNLEVGFDTLSLQEQKFLTRHVWQGHLLILCSGILFAYGCVGGVVLVLLMSAVPAVVAAGLLFRNEPEGCLAEYTQHEPKMDLIEPEEEGAVKSQDQQDEDDEPSVFVELRKDMPYTDARVIAPEIIRQMQAVLKTQEGRVSMESMLCALGALAGYACQRSLLVEVMDQKDLRCENIQVITTHDGGSFFDGEPLNYFLFRSTHSIWELALTDVKLEEDLPDLDDIVAYASQTMGTSEFGVPRLSAGYRAPHLPVEYVKMMWPMIFSVMRLICQNPAEWAAAFGFAIQKILHEYKEQLMLGAALTMVMESAVPMSRINLFKHFSEQRLM